MNRFGLGGFLLRMAGFLALIFLGALPSYSQQDSGGHLVVGLNFAGTGFSHIQETSPVLSPEISATWKMSSEWGLTVSGSMARIPLDYDIPGGTSSLTIDSWWLEAGLAYRLFSIAHMVEFVGTIGGGVTQVNRPESQIPLGGLGSATVPEASDTRGHLLAGIQLSREVLEPISLHLGTSFRFLSPFSAPETGYSVYGGLNIEVL
jgi:hypothetical protein